MNEQTSGRARSIAGGVAAAVVLTAGSVILSPQASASGCTLNGATMNVEVSDEVAKIARSGDQITVNGAPCGTVSTVDTINVTGSAGHESVDLGLDLAPGKTAEPSGVSEIEINIDLGADSDPSQQQRVVLRGTSGNDRITVGANGANLNGDDDADVLVTNTQDLGWIVIAAAGNDWVTGQGGAGTGGAVTVAMSLNGGPGHDRLTGGDYGDQLVGGFGNDVLDGAGHTGTSWGDSVSYFDAPGSVTVDLGAGTTTGVHGHDTVKNIESAVGSKFNDTLLGSMAPNHLIGYDGQDTIDGREGDDLLRGGAKTDTIIGGKGSDIVEYSDAPGGVEVDLRTQSALSPDGDETFSGIEGAIGSNFADTLTGDDGPNHLAGGPGVDAISGLGGDDRIQGGTGSDALSGGSGNDSIAPDEGRFGPDQGNDVAHGGSGIDLLNYSTVLDGVTVDLSAGTAGDGAGNDSVAGFENVVGTPANDKLTGDDGPNTLLGVAGDDELFGLGGDDALSGGPGDDHLDGGAGTDSCNGGGDPNDSSVGCE